MKKKIRLTHPELGEAWVMPSSLPVWLDHGWSCPGVEDAALPEPPSATPSDYADVAESDVTASPDLNQDTDEAESRS